MLENYQIMREYNNGNNDRSTTSSRNEMFYHLEWQKRVRNTNSASTSHSHSDCHKNTNVIVSGNDYDSYMSCLASSFSSST